VNWIRRTLARQLADEPMDSWLSCWGCAFGGVAVTAYGLAALWRNASNQSEFSLGALVVLATGSVLLLLGVTARRVHLAVSAGRTTWRMRVPELVSHVVGLGVVSLCGCGLLEDSPGQVGMLTCAVAILGIYASILCVGCWCTLRRSGGEA